MTTSPPAPHPQHARSGANPTLETLEYVRAALLASAEPLSRNRLLMVLAGWGHTTTRRSLNAALAFFAADGIVLEGRSGLVWAPGASPQLLNAVRIGRRG